MDMMIVQQILLAGQGLPLAPQVPNFTLESKPLQPSSSNCSWPENEACTASSMTVSDNPDGDGDELESFSFLEACVHHTKIGGLLSSSNSRSRYC